MWMGRLDGANVYDFEILSDIHSTIKRSCPTGKQKLGFSVKYPYHKSTKKSSVFYK